MRGADAKRRQVRWNMWLAACSLNDQRPVGLTTQSQTSTFAFGAATWRTRNITSYLISAHWLHYVKIWRHPQSRKYITYCTVVTSSKEDRATATGNMYRKVGENWICGIEMCERTDRQTKDRQMNETYRHADRNTLLTCRGRNNNLYFDRVINGYAYSHL